MAKTVKIKDKEFEVLISGHDIEQRIAEIASRINSEYKNTVPVFLGVMNGAFLFTADLLKKITLECELSFIRVSSYSGTSSTGQVKSVAGINDNIAGRDVIIVEDIVDTGDTMKYLLEELKKHKPASVKLATLVFKPAALRHPLKPDYVGFEVPPDFLVGFGLDYDGLGRNLNDIYTLRK